jgi:molecular chaperone GrpE (heat shock protein)
MAFIPPSELRRVQGTMPTGGASLDGTMSGLSVTAPPAPPANPFISLTDLAGLQQGNFAPQQPPSMPMDIGLPQGGLPPVPGVPAPAAMEEEPGKLDQLLQMLLVGGAAALAKDPRLFAEGILAIRKNVGDVRARNAAASQAQRGQDVVVRGQDVTARGQEGDLLGDLASAGAREAEAGARTTKAADTSADKAAADKAALAVEQADLDRKKAELRAEQADAKRIGAEEERTREKARADEAEKGRKKLAGQAPSIVPETDALKRLDSHADALPEKQRKAAKKVTTNIRSNLTRYRTQLLKQRKAGDAEPIITLSNGQQVAGAEAILATLRDSIPDALTEAGIPVDVAGPDAEASLSVLEEILSSWDAPAE